MTRVRDLIRRYPIAAIAVVVGVAALGGWTIYQSRVAQQPPATPVPPPRPTPPAAVTPTQPAPSAVTPTSPSGGAAPQPAGEGRSNPFAPLVSPQGPRPSSGGAAIPPVPSLPPGGGAPGAPVVAAPPPRQYRLAGVLWAGTALVILESGQDSYVVGPGDTVVPGTRVAAIEVRRRLVRLDRDGTMVDLVLSGMRQQP